MKDFRVGAGLSIITRWLRQHPLPGLAAFLLAVTVTGTIITLPLPAVPLRLSQYAVDSQQLVIPGAFHIHSKRSDGTGSVEEIAEIASKAGLQFLVFSDHGDGRTKLNPPTYHSGVLCLDAVEISTTGGHYVAFGFERSPYPLAGESRDVIADVARLGGFGIAAHPGSSKPGLSWQDWTLPFEGLEWVNGDSEWRDESLFDLAKGIAYYFLSPSLAIATFFDRPVHVMEEWDKLTASRPVLAVAGSDAHAKIGLGDSTGGTKTFTLLRTPSYESVFRALSIRAKLSQPLTGEALVDGERVIEAFRRGRIFSVIDSIASPAAFNYEAINERGEILQMGDRLEPGVPVIFRAWATVPPKGQIVLIKNGAVIKTVSGPTLVHRTSPKPGSFRIEIRVPQSPGSPPIPWIVSNPIYVFPEPVEPPSVVLPEITTVASLFTDGDVEDWHLEHSAKSRVAVDSTSTDEGRELAFRLALGGGDEAYAAIQRPLDLSTFDADRIVFRGRASRPLRISVQLRAPSTSENIGARWQRSVYLDSEMRDVMILFNDMRPADRSASDRPDLSRVNALLVVADTVNTAVGTSAIAWLDDIYLAQQAPSLEAGAENSLSVEH